MPDREPAFVAQISEEQDIEAVRRPSIGRQLWGYSWLLWAVPTLLAQCLIPTIPPPSPLSVAVLPTLLILIAAAHLINANVGIFRRLVLATPGRVEVSKFGRTVTFTRADSILMIHPGAFGRPAATLLRRDGKHCKVQFVRTTQPGFLALLARWSYPALISATAAQTPGPS